jgi:hypothetical protein
MNLMTAMVRLPMMAAKTAIFEPLCVVMDYFPVMNGWCRTVCWYQCVARIIIRILMRERTIFRAP